MHNRWKIRHEVEIIVTKTCSRVQPRLLIRTRKEINGTPVSDLIELK